MNKRCEGEYRYNYDGNIFFIQVYPKAVLSGYEY
jgi:hypothetical protein